MLIPTISSRFHIIEFIREMNRNQTPSLNFFAQDESSKSWYDRTSPAVSEFYAVNDKALSMAQTRRFSLDWINRWLRR